MNEIFCRNCKHYRQHYAFDQRKLFQVYCGHCTYNRPKGKRPDSEICEHYEHSDSNENAFVTKEYLSKALLEYMLKLDLLPKIYNTDTTQDIQR